MIYQLAGGVDRYLSWQDQPEKDLIKIIMNKFLKEVIPTFHSEKLVGRPYLQIWSINSCWLFAKKGKEWAVDNQQRNPYL